MSRSGKILYKLNEEEKKLLSYEFSKENIPYLLLELKNSFNSTYQYIMNIFKKVFNGKKNNNQLYVELDNYIKELEKAEMSVLNDYKILMFYLKLKNVDINHTDIILEIENEEEKKRLIALAQEREKNLKKYKENINKLEQMKTELNTLYEKMMSKNEMESID